MGHRLVRNTTGLGVYLLMYMFDVSSMCAVIVNTKGLFIEHILLQSSKTNFSCVPTILFADVELSFTQILM